MTDVQTPGPVTGLLAAARDGDRAAHDQLWALVYDELRRIAGRQMQGERDARTLQTTALVHEAYFRLVGDGAVRWNDRGHFFAAAANAMRHIRIDDARKRKRIKRGGGRRTVRLDAGTDTHAGPGEFLASTGGAFDDDPDELLALNDSLDQLERAAPRQAQVVKLRYFAGLTIDEAAQAMELSPRTVNAEWRMARAWLHRELSEPPTKAE